jgi:capsular exopolysaccharide synthesis family protein
MTLTVLYRHRWATIGVFLLVVGWVMVDSYTAVPMYRAVARVLIEDPGADVATPTEIAGNITRQDFETYLQTQLSIMKGRELSQRVASKIDLRKVAEFNGLGPQQTRLAKGISLVKFSAMWPYRLIAPGGAIPTMAPGPTDQVNANGYADALGARLSVNRVRGSQLVDMVYDSADPAFAALAVNQFADDYVDENLRLKISSLEKGAEWVAGEVARLQRNAESNQRAYDLLITREKELRVFANSRTNNVRVVDRAQVPGGPYTPDHRRDWIFAIAFGLVFGLGAAFSIDYLDDTVKTPEDITRRLKLRVLGMVPVVPGERHPLISGPVPHDFGEAYRSIRTTLAASFTGPGARVVAVASSQPLEGKTTTAVNLAMALAFGGARVLLIDADMRRPSVHKALRMTNERGLSQLLAGQARMREVVQRTHDPNLLTITAGRTPANPSELLASDRMRALLSGLETGPFDWIVIDTPPVLAVTDAMILAPLVSAVAFVLGSEMTRLRLAERAVETMLGSNPRLVLAVLNKVDVGRNKYYYSRYYGHRYKNYYAESPAA